MTITDAYVLGQHGVDGTHPLATMSIKTFAAAVAGDLVHMDFSTTVNAAVPFLPILGQEHPEPYPGPDSLSSRGTTFTFESDASTTSSEIEFSSVLRCVSIPDGAPVLPIQELICHPRGTHALMKSDKPRPLRRTCNYPGCKVLTTFFCIRCQKNYCCSEPNQSKNDTGRFCFYAHICKSFCHSSLASKEFRREFGAWEKEKAN
jgi:hypothetical protein